MEPIRATETLVDESLRETKMHGVVGFPVGVYLDDFTNFKNGYICWHWHEEVQISWIVEGEFQCQLEGESILLKPGDMVFLNSGVLHQIRPVRRNYGKLHAFIWDAGFISGSADGPVYQEAFEQILHGGLHVLRFAGDSPAGVELRQSLQQIVALYTQQAPCFHLQIKLLLTRVWLLIYQQAGDTPEPPRPERRRDEERMKLAMRYMRAHYNENFSLEELARQALTNRSELCRCFRRMLGIAPKEFLMQYRIQQARILLENPAYRIADIAEFTGFSSPSHFGSCFKEKTGLSPSAYRKQAGKAANQ